MPTALILLLLLSGCSPKPAANTEKYGTEKTLENDTPETGTSLELEDGEYTASVTLEGGSGRASIESSARITVSDGQPYATIVWSSANYDYMIVDGEKYFNENKEGNSTFTIPVLGFHYKMPVIADTTAMSTPHEVEYTLYFELVE